MGGDLGPRVTVSALLDFLHRHRQVSALVFGDQVQVGEQLSLSPFKDPTLLERVEVRHSDSQVVDSDKPSAVIRHKRDSSMGLALQALAAGEADAFISAGNTGAIMALGLYFVKPLPGISRPAICTTVPTISGHSYVLDLGANPVSMQAYLGAGAALDPFSQAIDVQLTPENGLIEGIINQSGTDHEVDGVWFQKQELTAGNARATGEAPRSIILVP